MPLTVLESYERSAGVVPVAAAAKARRWAVQVCFSRTRRAPRRADLDIIVKHETIGDSCGGQVSRFSRLMEWQASELQEVARSKAGRFRIGNFAVM